LLPIFLALLQRAEGKLSRFLADHWRTTVIDLGYGLFDQFFKAMAEISFKEEARQRSIQPTVLFITDSAPITAETYAELRQRLLSCPCIMKRLRSWSSPRIFRRHRQNTR
jgi:hypothetical protein